MSETINLKAPTIAEMKPKITVLGVGGGGGNAVNNMIRGGLAGCDFVVANTDAQALMNSQCEKVIQLGAEVTEGLGAGSQPQVGRAAAEECIDEIRDHLTGTHMAFVTAGMGGGTGTGAAPVVAQVARELGVLTVGVVTKPFQFEGGRRMQLADEGITELQKYVDTLIVIPNQNLFRIANEKTTFADAFGMADQVLYSGVACITDLMVKDGLINLDFADVRSVMQDMGKAMMGTGEANGERRAMDAAEAAISNPLLDETSMSGAKGLLISITGGSDMTLYEVDEAASRIREEVDPNANIIFGSTFDERLEGVIRVSVVATGIDQELSIAAAPITGHKPAEAITRSASAPAAAVAKPAPATPASVAPAAAMAAKQPAASQVHPTANATRGVEDRIAQAAAAMALPGDGMKPVVRDGVAIQKAKPAAALFSDPNVDDELRTALEAELMPKQSSFVPPAAEEPAGHVTSSHIPDVAPAPMTSTPEQAPAENNGTNGPMGLLNKLKSSFGASREEEITKQPASATPASPRPVPNNHARTTMVPAASDPMPAPRAPQLDQPRVDDNPYAPKRNGIDSHGRAESVSSSPARMEDDQLDIPAFLRRQAN